MWRSNLTLSTFNGSLYVTTNVHPSSPSSTSVMCILYSCTWYVMYRVRVKKSHYYLIMGTWENRKPAGELENQNRSTTKCKERHLWLIAFCMLLIFGRLTDFPIRGYVWSSANDRKGFVELSRWMKCLLNMLSWQSERGLSTLERKGWGANCA